MRRAPARRSWSRAVLIGCFLNSRAVARAVGELPDSGNGVVLVPAGELDGSSAGGATRRRFALEDYLGCGSILSSVKGTLTPEAELCRRSFDYSLQDYAELIWGCESGLELIGRGHEADIVHCVQRDLCGTLPVASGGVITELGR